MIAKLEHLNKIYFTSAGTFTTSEKTSINLNKGEIVVITSQSTYSKKTLLTLMGCLVHPNAGILEINGKSCIPSNSKDIALVKSQTIGFIFQRDNLLENLNAEENVAFPLRVQDINMDEIKQRTIDVLKRVKMYEDRKKMPIQLSSFQHQQIAIAKALIINPKIIICDRPTAHLERKNGTFIMKLLKEFAKEGKSIAILNHDRRYNEFADRAVELKNGTVSELILI
jgi:putative ABC transport system ATP-binding protein